MLNQLNFKEFLAWLSSHAKDDVAGIARCVTACPVACYATKMHGFSVHFSTAHMLGILRSLEDELVLHDRRFFRFAELLDEQFGYEEVSFADAREIASKLV